MLLLLKENDKEAFLETSCFFVFFRIVSIKRKLQDILYIWKFMAPAPLGHYDFFYIGETLLEQVIDF